MKYNEMINFFLLKQLPHDIKCLLYSAVAGYHKRKTTSGYCDVIKTIKNMKSVVDNADKCNSAVNIIYLSEFMYYADNPSYPLNYFYILEFEKALMKYCYNYSTREYTERDNEFIIRHNSPSIYKKYGESVYVYYLNESYEWIKFYHKLPYKCMLRFEDTQLHSTFMISEIDITNPSLNNKEIENAIENPIFKFSIYDQICNYFDFAGKGLTHNYIFSSFMLKTI